MPREGERYQAFSRRAFMMAGLQGLALTALGGRLYYLSVVQGEKYKLRAERNRVSIRLIPPERGEILDRTGRILAKNQPDFRVFLIPEQAGDVEATLIKLRDIVHLDERRLARLRQQIKKQRSFVPVTVSEQLDWETFSRLNVAMPYLPGVVPDAGLSRFYPSGSEVAHLLGYMGRPGEEEVGNNPLYQLPGYKLGREGLEREYEDLLRGKAGTRRVEVNSVGREIRELPNKQNAESGHDLSVTIDLDLQKQAISLLDEQAGGAVVMDVDSGEVLALASTPSFDPNEFNLGISQENWQGLLNDPRNPLLNKCLAGQFPPGSTIKMVVALAAMEAGIIDEDTSFTCRGRHKLGNHYFHCWKREGHGTLSLKDAIAKSCDVYFYKLAELLSVDQIAETARKFGLEEIFNIGIPGERSGLLPTEYWKQANFSEPWQKGETLIAAIGQGYMLATPLQLAVMMSRLATGRRVAPHLVVGDGPARPFETMDVNPVNLDSLRTAMEMVTKRGGTAWDFRRKKSATQLAGKTGTAQVRRITQSERDSGVLDNNELPWQSRDHALFVGYAPADMPRYAVSVLVQHGGSGSGVAAPIGRALLDKALEIADEPVGVAIAEVTE